MIVPLNELDFLKRALAVYGDKEAVVCGSHRLTYTQFGERTRRYANAMRALGVKKGDRIGILSQNCHRMIEAYFGAPQIGAISVPMNFRLVADDFEYILNHGGAKILIVEQGLEQLVEPIMKNLTTVEKFLIASDQPQSPTGPWIGYEQLLAEAKSEPPPAIDIDENETSALLYTSGTTGRPKGVMMTHRNLYMNAMNAIIEFGLNDTDRYLHGIALFHCNGWGLPYAVTGVGGTHLLYKKFEPEAVFNLMCDERATSACLAPTMINMLLNHPAASERQLPGLRVGTAGSAPPMAIIKAAQERFGWRIIQVYGLTETAPFLTVSKLKPNMRDWPEAEKYRVQTRTGYPMIGVELRVVDDDGNEVEPDGQQKGEVVTRANVVMGGYWKQPDATSSVMAGGWFHTGDVATIDEEGFIEVVDRKKDLIISGGENISSIEVEGVLYQHPGVLDAAIVAAPDEQWGEIPKAVVVCKPGISLEESELINFCRERLAHYKCPRSVEFVEALPRTATGKVQKAVLRDRYWAGRTKKV
jgi:fatty-acyl-CoA synthase